MKIITLLLTLILSWSVHSQQDYTQLVGKWHQCFDSLDDNSDTLKFKRSLDESCDNHFETEFHIHHREFTYTFYKDKKLEIGTTNGVKPKQEFIQDTLYTTEIVQDSLIDSLGRSITYTRQIKTPQILSFGSGKSNATYTIGSYKLRKKKNTLIIHDLRYKVILLTSDDLILRRVEE